MNINPTNYNQKNYSINSQKQNVQFKGYVDKAVKDRIRLTSKKQMQEFVERTNKSIERVVEQAKVFKHDVDQEKIQSLQEELKQKLKEIVTKTNLNIELLNGFMSQLHPNSVLKFSKPRNGRETVVIANKVVKEKYHLSSSVGDVPNYTFPLNTGADDFVARVLRMCPKEIDEKILEYAFKDIEDKSLKPSLINKLLIRLKMKSIVKYAKEINSTSKYNLFRHEMQFKLGNNRWKEEELSKLKKEMPQLEEAQQKTWDIFDNLLNDLVPKNETCCSSDVFKRTGK